MRTLFTLILFLTALAPFSYGQEQVVTGRVTEVTGDALPGVNVIVEGTSKGTVTDVDGRYQIKVSPDETLVFSFVGYKKQAIQVGNRSTIDVVLEPDQTQLEEIVVVGYGTMRKSDLTGSTVSVKVEEDVARQYNTVDEMLKGRAAGVQVISNEGNPGSGISVRIRGTNSLRGNNEPLYVVDGVIITTAGEDAPNASTDGNSTQQVQNGLNGINPRDIESIEILKDASATAIYGSRGANGVVLITTKKGAKGKMNIDAYATSSFSQISRKLPVLDGVDYAMYRNESAILNGSEPPFYINNGNVYTIDYTSGGPVINDTPSQIVNWQDEIYKMGISYNAGAAFSGGSEKGTFYVSAGYNDINGIVDNSKIQSGDLRVNIIQDISKNLKVDGRASIFYSQGSFAQDGTRAGSNRSFIRSVLTFSPIVDDDVEDYQYDLETSNPLSWINDFEDATEEFRVQASLALTYKLPVKGLKIQIRGGSNVRFKERRRFYGLTTFKGERANGVLSIGTQKKLAFNINNLLLYNRVFNKAHSVNATLGYVFDGYFLENTAYEVSDFAATDFTVDGPEYGALITRPLTTFPANERMNSFLGRFNYSYRDKYIVTATFRADGSSKFAEGNKYSYFPSFSLAWRITEEGFMQNQNFFSDLKIRAGWGQTGNQAIAPYQTFANYGIAYYARPDNSTGIAFVPQNIANPDLIWETTTQTNIGIDLGFFEGRVTATVDLYDKKTEDLLQLIQLPTSTGFANMLINRGNISNRGIDILVNTIAVDKNDFYLAIGGNISFNRNKVLELGIPEAPVYIDGELRMESFYLGDNVSTGNYFKSPANIFMAGQPVGMFWGWKTDGIYQANDSEILPGFQPGDVKIIDQNGDGVIDLTDRTFIGDPNPDFIYGGSVEFSYKRLTLNMLVEGVYGNEIANGLAIEFYTANGTQRNIHPAAYHDAWRPEKPSNSYPRVLYDKDNGASAITDRIIEDGSYFRLSNITLGYDLPFEKAFNRFRIYVSGQNLLTSTKYSSYDPNVTSFLYNGNIQGVDWNPYPNARTYLVGLNISF